jgi:acyl-CoA thioesterase FadM
LKEKIDSILIFFNRFSCVGPCFTANLNVDYLKPLSIPAWILVRAHVERHEGRKVYIHGTVENGEGVIYAKAVALFIKPKLNIKEHIEQNQDKE